MSRSSPQLPADTWTCPLRQGRDERSGGKADDIREVAWIYRVNYWQNADYSVSAFNQWAKGGPTIQKYFGSHTQIPK